jgi:hypothetical protein
MRGAMRRMTGGEIYAMYDNDICVPLAVFLLCTPRTATSCDLGLAPSQAADDVRACMHWTIRKTITFCLLCSSKCFALDATRTYVATRGPVSNAIQLATA